jgi:signal transduction histidine kinase
MIEPGWLTRLESGSLRRHYSFFLSVVVGTLVVSAVVSAATLVWAAASVRDQAVETEELVELQDANHAVMNDVTDAYIGLHRGRSPEKTESLPAYELPLSHLPTDQSRLEELAARHRPVAKAVTDQRAAVAAWLEQYAEPLTADGFTDAEAAALSPRGEALFIDVRRANAGVEKRIEGAIDSSRGRTWTVVLTALAVVALLPLAAIAAVAFLGSRLRRSVVEPLAGITKVLDQLRAGQEDARAVVTGPDEVRRIAAGLNLLTEENLRASEVEADVLMQLQTIDRVRTDLVSTVSHELRTPLASIKGYLELLQDELAERMTPQQTSMMGVIRRNLDRLNELIANLLALSRAEETELSVQPMDLRGVATEVGTDIRLTAAGRDIAIRTLHSPGPVTVLGDRSQLIRAVQNLVTNAVKFSRPGGTVELRVTQEGDQAVLEVADEGIGIPAADLPGLGSRFYRASNAVQAEIAGTGLGLRIVQTILDRHSGTLSVDSLEGEGTTFTVRLPVSPSSFEPRGDSEVSPLREPQLSRD